MSEVIAPLNLSGDTQPGQWDNGNVTTSPGFRDAFKSFGEAGWQGIQHPTQYGGQGLPKIVGAACMEMMQAANLSFALCPLLTDGAIEALLVAGSDEQKDAYLPAADRWQLDRHDEPDRAAGGFGPRAGAHPCRAAGRRHVSRLRPEDLHHVRRSRSRREHRAPRAGPHAERARGRQGDFALHRAEGHVRGGWHAR